MPEEYIVQNDGKCYNKFGSLVYPKIAEAKRKKEIQYKSRLFLEFEIQAVAYIKLREFFNNDCLVRGEYSLKSNDCDKYPYLRCDIALLDKYNKIIVIIEVKRNKDLLNNSATHTQLELLKKHAPVLTIASMEEADKIVQTLILKGYINQDSMNWKDD